MPRPFCGRPLEDSVEAQSSIMAEKEPGCGVVIPRLHIGIGCRRGISETAIHDAVKKVLEEHQIHWEEIQCAATIDLKANEEGLLAFCQKRNWPVYFYSAEELRALKGNFSASDFVQSVTGVDNVCERAALAGADSLIVGKTVWNGVTVAVAAERLKQRHE